MDRPPAGELHDLLADALRRSADAREASRHLRTDLHRVNGALRPTMEETRRLRREGRLLRRGRDGRDGRWPGSPPG